MLQYQHEGGIYFLYKNDTGDKVLAETVEFQLEGLTIEGVEGDKVEFELQPYKEKVIKLNVISGAYSIGYSTSTLVKDVPGDQY